MQDGEELEIESSPMWLEQSSWSAKNQVTNFSIYNNSIRKIGKYPVVAMAIGFPHPSFAPAPPEFVHHYPTIISTRLCWRVASVCLSVQNVLWLNGAS